MFIRHFPRVRGRAPACLWRVFAPVFLSVCAALCGCNLGPRAFETNRPAYNDAIVQTSSQELLLNMIRLKYREPTLFLEVSNVTTQFNFLQTANITGTLNEGPTPSDASLQPPDQLRVGGSVIFQERPTITLTPLQGEDFVTRMLSPLELEILTLATRSGWRIDRVFRITVQSMNGLNNAWSASGPTPRAAPEYREFMRVAELFAELQKKKLLVFGEEIIEQPLPVSFAAETVSVDTLMEMSQKGFMLQTSEEDGRLNVTRATTIAAWRVPPATRETPEAAEIIKTLGLVPDREWYEVKFGRQSQIRGERQETAIVLTTRSLTGILSYLAQAVEVPEEHREKGWVTTTLDAAGQPFEWSDLTGDLLAIRSQKASPGDKAAIAVQYLGHWYYIDNSDLMSKSTFNLISQLFALQAGEVKAAAPLLTLDVGG
jgi:hypothetical protein